MSDYMAKQTAISFRYDATLEVVTDDGQKLGLASSGEVSLERPNKVYASRSGGFSDVALLFNGETMTVIAKGANLYTQVAIPGNLDHLIDTLQNEYQVPLPAADLLTTDVYKELMQDVIDVKDLGSGVIDGVECDSLAFRKKDFDVQIWIAQGEQPYPCRYVITSTDVAKAPEYRIQTRNWKTGAEVASTDFTFDNATDAKEVDLQGLRDKISELPQNFVLGGKK